MENKQITYKEHKDGKMFWKKHHFDIIFIAIFLTSFIVELCLIQSSMCYIDSETNEKLCDDLIDVNSNIQDIQYYINNILFIIVPLADTIITLSITIPDFSVFGVEYRRFRKIRGDYEYSIIAMIVISITLLVLTIVSYYLNLFVTTVILNCMSIFYLILFIYKEVRILTKNETYLFKIVRNANIDNALSQNGKEKEQATANENESTDKNQLSNKNIKIDQNPVTESSETILSQQELLKEINKYLLIEYGITKTYKILYSDRKRGRQGSKEIVQDYNSKLIYNLLVTQNDLLKSCVENVKFIKMSNACFQGLSVSKIIESSANNILDILENTKTPNLFDILCKDDSYILGKSIMQLKELVDTFGLNENYLPKFTSCVTYLFPDEKTDLANSLKEDSPECLKLRTLNYLLVKSLEKGDSWFIDIICSDKSAIFDKKSINLDYYLFIYVYLNYLTYFDVMPKKINNKIIDFMRLWRAGQSEKFISLVISIYDLDTKIDTLNNLLEISHLGNDTHLWHYTPKDTRRKWYYPAFNDNFIIWWWINHFDLTQSDLKSENDSHYNEHLNESNYLVWSNYSPKQLDENSKTEDVINSDNGEIPPASTSSADEKSDANSNANQDVGNETTSSGKIDEGLIKFIKDQLKQIDFYDDSISLDDAHPSNPYKEITDSGDNLRYFFNVKENKNCELLNFIFPPIVRDIESKIFNDNNSCFDSYSKDVIEAIKKISPVKVNLSLPEDVLNSIDGMSIEDLDYINSIEKIHSLRTYRNDYYYDIYCGEGAIKINAELTQDSDFHNLTPLEAEDFVDNFCLMQNGLYRYNYDGKIQCIENRSEVVKLAQKEKQILIISIKSKFEIDKSKILVVKTKRDKRSNQSNQ